MSNNEVNKIPLKWEINFDHSHSDELLERYYSGEITYEEFCDLISQR